MEEKQGLFNRLKKGLEKTRNSLKDGMETLFEGSGSIDEDFYEELEEILIMADVGVSATEKIIEQLKEDVKKEHIREPEECKALIMKNMMEAMQVKEEDYDFLKQTSVIMVTGVNGVGKTTTIGKMAALLKARGKKVLIASCDTFRAAANEQLTEWSRRAGVDMISGREGCDPSSVLFDAVSAAKARHADILLCDTAGRLHNKKNLMEELKKMNRIIAREFPEAKQENLIVLDGSTGQNALVQAREFSEAAPVSGIVLTKMDGTAKGGIAVAIQSELGVPVKFIGVGEGVDDLQFFDSSQYINALFDVQEEE